MSSTRVLDFKRESEAFQKAFNQELSTKLDAMRAKAISAQNFFRYSHSPRWKYHGPKANDDESSMQLHSVEMGVKFEDVIQGNDSVIEQQITRAVSEFEGQFLNSLYATVSEACDKIGNVVTYKGQQNFPDAFLAMLNKIEFSIDKDGRPSLPQIHLPADSFEKIMEEMNRQPQSYLDELEEIKARKIREAYERETARVSRFRANG